MFRNLLESYRTDNKDVSLRQKSCNGSATRTYYNYYWNRCHRGLSAVETETEEQMSLTSAGTFLRAVLNITRRLSPFFSSCDCSAMALNLASHSLEDVGCWSVPLAAAASTSLVKPRSFSRSSCGTTRNVRHAQLSFKRSFRLLTTCSYSGVYEMTVVSVIHTSLIGLYSLGNRF